MTALVPISSETFKALLERYGFIVQDEDEYNWTLFRGAAAHPVIVLPKIGKVLTVDVMMGILDKLQIDNKEYFKLLKSVSN